MLANLVTLMFSWKVEIRKLILNLFSREFRFADGTLERKSLLKWTKEAENPIRAFPQKHKRQISNENWFKTGSNRFQEDLINEDYIYGMSMVVKSFTAYV